MGDLRATIVRARLQPRLLATGALEDLYIAGGGNCSSYRFGVQDYKAGLANLPRFKARFDWDEDGWTGGVVPTTGDLEWSPSMAADYKAYSSNYHWKDAPILVEVGEEQKAGTVGTTNLVTNGTFASASNWTLFAGVTISGGTLNCASAAEIADQLNVFQVGGTYLVEFDTNMTSGAALRLGMAPGVATPWAGIQNMPSGVGRYSQVVVALIPDLRISAHNAAYSGTIDNVTVVPVSAAGEPLSWTTVLTGAVAGIAAEDGFLTFTIADLSAKLDKPVAASRFAGTGGIEGPTEAKTRPKRRSWGKVFNVECRILDKVNSIWEFGDPVFQSASVEDVRDMGRSASPAATVLAWQGSVSATFAALQSSIPVPGSGVVAPSIQCVKWWTIPVGPLTVDITGEGGGTISAPYLAQAILANLGLGVTIADAERNAAHTLRPDDAGIHVGDERLTVAQTLDQLLLGTSLLWVLNPNGAVNLRTISLAAPVEVLTSLQVSRTKVLAPTKTRRVGYKRNNREHGDGEISATLEAGTDVIGGGGGNELLDTQFGSSWAFSLGMARLSANASGGYALGNEPYFLEVSPSTTTQRDATSTKVSIQATQRYYFEFKVQRGTTLGSGSKIKLFGEWFNAAGTSLGELTGVEVVPGDLTTGAAPKAFRFSAVAPTNATQIRLKVRSPALASSSGTFRVEAPRVQAYEFGADITQVVNGPTAEDFIHDSAGTAQAGQYPRDLTYKLVQAGAALTSGVTWNYRVITGLVEGNDYADSWVSMSGTGFGVLNIADGDLGATSSTIEVRATYAGQTFLAPQTTLTKSFLAPPVGGGGGGGGGTANTTDSQTSAFTSINSTTFVAVSKDLTITVGSSSTTATTNVVNLDFYRGTDGGNGIEAKVQAFIGGVWTDQGATVTAFSNRETHTDGEGNSEVTNDPAHFSFSRSHTGLTSGASFKTRIVARLTSGTNSHNVSGQVTLI